MKKYKRSASYLAVMGALLSSYPVMAEDVVELDKVVTEDTIDDDIGLIPTDPVDSVFGFDQTIEETPRSVTLINAETIERFGMTDIDDLVTLSSGVFTQSFFGVAGSLDVRGTPGETYFRGMRRLDNPGNYPTPIGASDSIIIVKGPASPIMGPAKIGGYLDFIPKSSRADTGKYLEKETGKISYTTGSWNQSILTGEVGGPGNIAGKDAGYYVYFMTEDSDSYYDNTSTDQSMFQGSFSVDIDDTSRIEFGGMYHDFEGNQVAGWNRLTQDLIDSNGRNYTTGTAKSLDINGDGSISHPEFADGLGGHGVAFSFRPEFVTDGQVPDAFNLENPGKGSIDGSDVLVAEDDTLQNEDYTLYLDYFKEINDSWSIVNKIYYEDYKNLNENAYGFSQFHDSSVFENKFIVKYTHEGDGLTTGVQFSPSIRYTEFEHGSDFADEFFDRRDLTGPSTARDRVLLSTRSDSDYTDYSEGDYLDIGLALMTNLEFDNGLGVMLGARRDFIDADSSTPLDKLLNPDGQVESASESDAGTSWTVSVNYKTPIGLTPYVTKSEQYTVIAGQGAEITPGDIAARQFTGTSSLEEAGIKGNFFDNRLYFSLATYEQERTDRNAQAIVTNQTAKTRGTELEMRFLATENLSITGAYTYIKVRNLNADGGRFSFAGADDLTGVSDPALVYGGGYGSIVQPADGSTYKAGIPENSYSLSAAYDFKNGVVSTLSWFHADSTFSGYSQAVKLPSYDLFNLGLGYYGENWEITGMIKNLTDETYYRSNFSDLFGSTIVLPELPRSYTLTAAYKF